MRIIGKNVMSVFTRCNMYMYLFSWCMKEVFLYYVLVLHHLDVILIFQLLIPIKILSHFCFLSAGVIFMGIKALSMTDYSYIRKQLYFLIFIHVSIFASQGFLIRTASQKKTLDLPSYLKVDNIYETRLASNDIY